ncbi:MAG: hypothetical protein A2015_04195 [Spirochaetes bacterium GWF1_31_7]|nr:MAG: hypothetical protein A2Y30_17075 [Spirochaetes bacterium GWE1_32_154]OHD47409.1 MAG: hypothetical protein A2Y29_10085 [Spirochaetes bacterium GWE2_31_10]OHD52924.1 MAG: hypothetical protein A2015_04195 [Spirochaetes bacterium GWF1_31_7]OHD79839.1 MAG: hypothetical protein A2355_11700 [Spirochaetes bacterium RIFOXYB1_FULL_32_8]HBD95758.1 class I SAM-dependent methyltransferase [Spirochaetia bacterium]
MKEYIIVEKYYNENAEQEWRRFDEHPVEFEITKRILGKYMPESPAKVIDIGGGPGRYALWLSSKGYDVTLFDLAEANIDYAKKEANKQNIILNDYIVGNAIELDFYVTDKKYDVVLLMGPLYHLTSESDRKRAVEQALSVLKENGIIIASFISGYAPIIDVLKNYPDGLKGNVSTYIDYLENGIHIVSENNPVFTNTYFIPPSNIDLFMKQFNIEKIGMFTAESILGPYENQIRKCDKDAFEACIELAMNFIEDENCRGCGEHLIYIGRKQK